MNATCTHKDVADCEHQPLYRLTDGPELRAELRTCRARSLDLAHRQARFYATRYPDLAPILHLWQRLYGRDWEPLGPVSALPPSLD